MSRDELYSLPLERVGDFTFDESVVAVFPDMIARSVPGYGSVLSMIGELAEGYAQPASRVYDLGCSLGAATHIMRARIPTDCTLVAVDSSEAMMSALREGLTSAQGIELRCEDIRKTAIEKASFSVLNFTLQFIPLGDREQLLARIAEGTLPGGALVLSEKIRFDEERQQQLMSELHHSFKRANGYSQLEIAQKRTALENTLIPETTSTHLERLRKVGFSVVSVWFQCFNFVSILALK